MLVGVVCLVVAVLSHDSVGGLTGLIENLGSFESLPGDPNPTTGEQLTNIFGGSAFKFLCVNIMLTSFGTWGLPQMIGKFYAIKDKGAIKRGTIISTIFCIVIGCGAYLIGSTSRLILGGATLVISLNSGFSAAVAKSPEMGICAMAVSLVVVPLVSLITKKKAKDEERAEEIFSCYKENN